MSKPAGSQPRGIVIADRAPLNGTRTHPLSAHAIDVLRDLFRGPVRRHLINPGVRDRLSREDLAEEIELPLGPKSEMLLYVRITEAGIARLEELNRNRG